MINARKAGLALAALFSAVVVVPVLADGASDFQSNAKKATSTLDQIAQAIDGIHARVAAGGGSSASSGAQQVADTEETMKCPVCGMTMTAKASGKNTKSVTIKGKTYYCCAGCNMTSIADKPANGARRNGARRQRQPAPKQ
ncbi:MAG TPA: hypothetical protein VKT77_23050 [Chthonomonadaceae bacterium]|nr:hypothetical protein [Chthonomonadaceae bacterium]